MFIYILPNKIAIRSPIVSYGRNILVQSVQHLRNVACGPPPMMHLARVILRLAARRGESDFQMGPEGISGRAGIAAKQERLKQLIQSRVRLPARELAAEEKVGDT